MEDREQTKESEKVRHPKRRDGDISLLSGQRRVNAGSACLRTGGQRLLSIIPQQRCSLYLNKSREKAEENQEVPHSGWPLYDSNSVVRLIGVVRIYS